MHKHTDVFIYDLHLEVFLFASSSSSSAAAAAALTVNLKVWSICEVRVYV